MINLVAVQAVTKVLFGQSAVGQFRSHLPLGLALLVLTALATILAPAVRAEQKIQVKPDPELAAVVNMTTVDRQSNIQNVKVKNVESAQGNKVSFASPW
jgi:hypothetical protein